MNKLLFYGAIVYVCLFLFLHNISLSLADRALEEPTKLLQKSLTLFELDQEINRLTEQEMNNTRLINDSAERIVQQNQKLTASREHAGKVLRAYYMGERDSIWMLLFSAHSFSDALVVFDYLNMIFANDKQALSQYQSTFQELQVIHKQQQDAQLALQQVKNTFQSQRERARALQAELDLQISQQPEIPTILAQIVNLTSEWKQRGLPLFRTYFKAISETMQSLPDILAGDNKGHYLVGLSFQISDQELNQFFRSKNTLFNNINFRFAKGQFLIDGKEGDVRLFLSGHYTVEQMPSNKLQFHVDELKYNDFVLPDTTNRSLEEQFDLGFSPEKFISFIQATNVTLEDGKLIVQLKITLR